MTIGGTGERLVRVGPGLQIAGKTVNASEAWGVHQAWGVHRARVIEKARVVQKALRLGKTRDTEHPARRPQHGFPVVGRRSLAAGRAPAANERR
jgi:hypothetical protein